MADAFRDFGIVPEDATPPVGIVRTSFSTGTIIGQFIATGIMSLFGLGIAVLFAFTLPMPINFLAALVFLALTAYVVHFVTRNDYSWIELDGETLRARHMYTGRIVERDITEIEDLQTQVLQVRTVALAITEAWLGRIRGVAIRFRDKRSPLKISRADPAMRDAKEFIQALVYRMSKKGKVEAEIIDFRGSPLVRRLYWRDPPSGPTS